MPRDSPYFPPSFSGNCRQPQDWLQLEDRLIGCLCTIASMLSTAYLEGYFGLRSAEKERYEYRAHSAETFSGARMGLVITHWLLIGWGLDLESS